MTCLLNHRYSLGEISKCINGNPVPRKNRQDVRGNTLCTTPLTRHYCTMRPATLLLKPINTTSAYLGNPANIYIDVSASTMQMSDGIIVSLIIMKIRAAATAKAQMGPESRRRHDDSGNHVALSDISLHISIRMWSCIQLLITSGGKVGWGYLIERA